MAIVSDGFPPEFYSDQEVDSSVLHRLLPESITGNRVWKDFALAVENILKDTHEILVDGKVVPVDGIWKQIESLKTLRNPETISSEFLSLLSSLLGFDQKSQYFVEKTYRRIVAELCRYYEKSGTSTLGDFMGLITQTDGKIEPLWANIKDEYGTHFRNRVPIGQKSIYDGGHWYMTPHVNYMYRVNEDVYVEDVLGPDIIAKITMLQDPVNLTKLFYDLAPVHLVLEKIIAQLYAFHKINITACWKVRNCYADEAPGDGFQVAGGWKFRVLEKSLEIA